MLLAIKKIDSHPAKDATGAIKRNPSSGEALTEKKVLDEAIDVWLIKAVRPFHKGGSYRDIEGDVSVVYLRPSEGKSAIEVHVVGNWRAILKEINELRSYGGRSKSDSTNIVS